MPDETLALPVPSHTVVSRVHVVAAAIVAIPVPLFSVSKKNPNALISTSSDFALFTDEGQLSCKLR